MSNCGRRDERERELAEIYNLSKKNMVYVTFVHSPVAKTSHMIKPNIINVEMDNPLTGKGE